MENFPKTYIGRYPTAASLTIGTGRSKVRSLSRSTTNLTNNWAFVEETNTIWAQNKDGEWIDTGKAFIRTDTYKGNPLTADGTVKWEMQGLKVFGKSKQASTTGAQLISIADGYGEAETNGVTKTPKDISVWNFSGIATETSIFYPYSSRDRISLSVGTYTLSIYGTSKAKVRVNRGNIGSTGYAGSGENLKINVESEDTININFKIDSCVDSTGILYIMLNSGSTALP